MHTRVALISFTLVMIHVTFWMPWLVINVLLSIGQGVEEGGSLPVELRITTLVIGYIPSVTDPVLYAFMQPEIGKAFQKLKKTIRKK